MKIKNDTCVVCTGSGRKNGYPCHRCKGTGVHFHRTDHALYTSMEKALQEDYDNLMGESE
jgi:DnaJ-class molecular chaperone